MKLGDSMAPIEAHSVWNEVCPQKTRPPKIGDIPRHVAVDKESPSCSSSRSLGQFLEEKPAKSMLERSTSCQPGHEKSKLPEASPVIDNLFKSSVTTNSNKNNSRISDTESSKFSGNTSQDSRNKVFGDDTVSSAPSIFSEILKNGTELEILNKNPSLRVSESSEENDEQATLWGDEERIYEVRKDSALYIDERNIESLKFSDNCLATEAAESGSLKTPGSSSPSENSEEINNWKLSKPRARRESSGYFSNLGTFDEDRWITNTMDLTNQQDLIASREISRERRTSSTKNRLPSIYDQPQKPLQLPIGPSCGQQSTKVPNIVYPSTNHIEQTLQIFSPNELTNLANPKVPRTEMPDIEEQISLELDKSINFDSSNEHDDVASICSHEDIDLSLKISQLSMNNGSGSKDDFPTTIGIENEENIDESTESSKNVLNAEDKSGRWSSGACSRARTSVKPQNGKIIDRLNGRVKIFEKNDCSSNLKNCTSLQDCCTFDETILDEDDNEQVVTAVLEEPRKERNSLTETRKALPKPIKVYQLLSTQSEDRGDDEARIFDRRISLQVTRPTEDETIRQNCQISLPNEQRNGGSLPEEKKLVHADSVPILKISRSSDLLEEKTERRGVVIDPTRTSPALEIFSSSGGPELSTEEPSTLLDKPSGSTIPAIRPIYPYCPYSPYGSPQGSPRTNRKRPLRESRRVSIDSRQGALQLNQYKLLNNIGQGSYGIVKLAYNEEDDTHYAMKILSKKKLMKKAGIFGRIAPGRKSSSNPLAKVYREIALLKKLDHPNVVKLVEVLDDPDEDNLYLVFELVQKGEVLQIPTDKPLDEETARKYFRDVVMGVEYLHYQRIVHRDIKPSNLLVDSEGRVKVADLGVSAELRAAGELLTGSAGTPAFAAPETSTPGAEYSGTLCDVWSMGVTLYCLVTGKVPWDGSGSIIGVQAAIRSEQLRFPEKPRLSEDLYDLLSKMLAKDPVKRINLPDIKEHCWLTNNGNEALPSETENCRLPVTVTDEEVARVVTRVPKLDTLILIKTMLKQHSFQNPFLPRRTVRTTLDSVANAAMKKQTSNELMDSSKNSISLGKNLATKTEKFHNDGRSNSAPDRYEWHTNGRQMSSDSLLAPVKESSSQETEMEKR